jgi:hypothetical protein
MLVHAAGQTSSCHGLLWSGNDLIQTKDRDRQNENKWNCNQESISAGEEKVLFHGGAPVWGKRRMSVFSWGQTGYRRIIRELLLSEVTRARAE